MAELQLEVYSDDKKATVQRRANTVRDATVWVCLAEPTLSQANVNSPQELALLVGDKGWQCSSVVDGL